MIGRSAGRLTPTPWTLVAVGVFALLTLVLVAPAVRGAVPPGRGVAPPAERSPAAIPVRADPGAGTAIARAERITTPSPTAPTVTGQAPDPKVVRIERLGVDAPLIPLDLRVDGSIEVPAGSEEAGWWRDGPEPGEPGPAVIYGHVDSRSGPAVFYRLGELVAGDRIEVIRVDGSVVAYHVDRIEQHPKSRFPTDAVYGPTEGSVLRLVTCGGAFNRSERSYVDNVIVFASPVTG